MALALALVGCQRPPDGVIELRIEDPVAHWGEGFARLETPVHMPSPSASRDDVEVWIALGTAPVGLQLGDDGVPRLRFGPGTQADRLEYAGEGEARRLVDVRGSRFEADGSCTHHVLRPIEERPDAPLVGMQWPCDVAPAQQAATAAMLERLAGLPPFTRMQEGPRHRALDGFAERNDCDGCHAEARPDATVVDAYGPVFRGTDASGLFAPMSVMRDRQPVEAYGGFDRNLDDPAITASCDGAPAERAEVRHGVMRWRCVDGGVPVASLDWEVLRRTDAARADAICASRRLLVGAMDDAAKTAFAPTLAPCDG